MSTHKATYCLVMGNELVIACQELLHAGYGTDLRCPRWMCHKIKKAPASDKGLSSDNHWYGCIVGCWLDMIRLRYSNCSKVALAEPLFVLIFVDDALQDILRLACIAVMKFADGLGRLFQCSN